LNVAAIGAGGKGAVDIGYCAEENVVALCDVDEVNAAASFRKFPDAKRFKDFRVMLDQAGGQIDAVTISIPDHSHAYAAAMAMDLGKHVYLQKPLTHSVAEARFLMRMARRKRLVTQMGNQGHSEPGSRRLVELIRAGVLGDVREAHVWTDRPIWPQGMNRPPAAKVPPTLDWDLWLGPAPWREFHEGCVPFKWRAFWDFGTGALGDMGCHNMDLAFFALGLRDPEWVETTCSGVSPETAPAWSVIRTHFPALAGRPPVTLTWYDGGKKPDPALVKLDQLPANGCILIGSRDTLYVPLYWGRGSFVSGARMEDFSHVAEILPRLPGAEKDHDAAHHHEWIAACKGQGRTLSDFDYAGPMTEAVLLGNVALRAGTRIEWDAAMMRVKNNHRAQAFIKRSFRKGWELAI